MLVELLRYSAFYQCSNLTSVNIPKGVKYIEGDTFNGCKNLKNIHFSEGLEKIGNTAFAGCVSLEEIDLPDSLISMGRNAFLHCDMLYDKENGLVYVDDWLVSCDKYVTSVDFKSNTAGIAAYVFEQCAGITNTASAFCPPVICPRMLPAFWRTSSWIACSLL